VHTRFSLIAAGMLVVTGFVLAAASARQKPAPVPVVVYKSPT
jgi:hypothetical protein